MSRGEIWYALFGWRTRDEAPGDGRPFHGHRTNGYPALLGAFVLVIVVETAVVHLLVSQWREPVAWVLTALGVYSIVWLIGDFNAARALPTLVTDDRIEFRTGLRWRGTVARDDVVGVSRKAPAEGGASLTLFGAPSLWLECAEPVTVRGPFGITRQARFLGLAIDDPDAFIAELDVPSRPGSA